jgi:hypothetical protein
MKKYKGRTLQRERRIFHGNYLTVHVFPVFQIIAGARRRKGKATTETQKKLNQKYREEKIMYLMNENFEEGDLEIGLSYSDEMLPENYEDVQKDIRNFVRRLKRYRAKENLPEIKYLYVIERGGKGGRWHAHFATNGDMNRDVVESLWGKGTAHTFRMHFDEEGLKGIAKYKVKEPETPIAELDGKKIHRWGASKNLKKPRIPKDRDGFISKKTVAEIREGKVAEREIERLYPGYIVTNWEAMKNTVNNGEYLTIQLRKAQTTMTNKEVFKNAKNTKSGSARHRTKRE